MTHNAANPQSVEEKEKIARAEADQIKEDIRDIISTDAGLRFFRRLVEDGHIFHSTFKNSGWTAFYEGERNIALRYFNDICEAAPHKVAELMIKKGENDE